jgi:hypothetical protein
MWRSLRTVWTDKSFWGPASLRNVRGIFERATEMGDSIVLEVIVARQLPKMRLSLLSALIVLVAQIILVISSVAVILICMIGGVPFLRFMTAFPIHWLLLMIFNSLVGLRRCPIFSLIAETIASVLKLIRMKSIVFGFWSFLSLSRNELLAIWILGK